MIKDGLGFHEHYANNLILEDGKIKGEVEMPILDQNAKRVRLDLATEQLGITADDVITVGDGANDRGMTERVVLVSLIAVKMRSKLLLMLSLTMLTFAVFCGCKVIMMMRFLTNYPKISYLIQKSPVLF